MNILKNLYYRIMADRARNRTVRVCQRLDGLRRSMYRYLCQLMVQVAESPADPENELLEELIIAVQTAITTILTLRGRFIKRFFIQFPGYPLEEAGTDHDPGAQEIFAQRML